MISSRSRWYWKLGLTSLSLAQTLAHGNYAVAQLAPDRTLGAESSAVTPNLIIRGLPSNRIDGGATRGINLFHSFLEFNVGAGRAVYFTNPTGIQNIITRVTGTNPSNLFGKLGVLGNANVFLINPNGIMFGHNSSLDVRGSFIASTANSLKFADGTEFSATSPQTSHLLTISVPIGLQFGGNQGSIVNQSQATDTNDNTVGLQVVADKTLALVGGNVSFDGGVLTAPGGRVELGGVAGSGTVGLNVNAGALNLSFPDGVALANVSLTNTAQVNVQAGGGGSIAIAARDLNLAGASRLLAGIASKSGAIDSQAGDIDIKVTGAISLTNGSIISNTVRPGGKGKGGNINIRTGLLKATNLAYLDTSTYGQGDAGSVTINANGSVSFDRSSSVYSLVGSTIGKGGNINIAADSLFVTNDSQLNVSTYNVGDAGSITINTIGPVSFDRGSGAVSSVQPGAIGKAGNINITTSSLSLTNGAKLAAGTVRQGDAGNVTINASGSVSFDGPSSGAFSEVGAISTGKGGDINVTASSLSLTNGAQLSTKTFGSGNAGNINLKITDGVRLSGSNNVTNEDASSGLFASTDSNSQGNGGNIFIDPNQLTLEKGAFISVSSSGRGNAGRIQVFANSFLLSQGMLTATSASGKGGDIQLQIADKLLLRRNSLISAINSEASGNGFDGNININTPLLVAIPSENSDITATATAYRRSAGSNIQINAQGILGIQFQKQLTPGSDIVATGTVNLNTPQVNPSLGLVTLPVAVIDPAKKIVQGCGAGNGTTKGGQFTVTGRGGLPSNPDGFLSSDVAIADTRLPATTKRHHPVKVSAAPPAAVSMPAPATRVVFNGSQVTLVAASPTAIEVPWLAARGCYVK